MHTDFLICNSFLWLGRNLLSLSAWNMRCRPSSVSNRRLLSQSPTSTHLKERSLMCIATHFSTHMIDWFKKCSELNKKRNIGKISWKKSPLKLVLAIGYLSRGSAQAVILWIHAEVLQCGLNVQGNVNNQTPWFPTSQRDMLLWGSWYLASQAPCNVTHKTLKVSINTVKGRTRGRWRKEETCRIRMWC